jgi:hypothetical protein
MVFFDLLKDAPKEKEISNEILTEEDIAISDNFSKGLVPSFEIPIIPEKIRNLLWIADGKYKNYDPDDNKKLLFENKLFRIEYFGCPIESSAIFTGLPISFKTRSDPKDNIGYFPTYRSLSPGQRWTYLEWLCDIQKPINVGYVFIFYYGLERHLVYGKYRDAMDLILFLKQYHKNNSFQFYSNNAMIMSSILHKDKDALLKILENIEDGSYHGNLLLLAKYLMRLGLAEKEIISLSHIVGFKNQRYLKNYPDLFKEKIKSLLISEFGTNTLPFYELETKFNSKEEIVFANISFSHEVRSPLLPSIIDNEVFKASIIKILSVSHDSLKTDLAEIRKARKKSMLSRQ